MTDTPPPSTPSVMPTPTLALLLLFFVCCDARFCAACLTVELALLRESKKDKTKNLFSRLNHVFYFFHDILIARNTQTHISLRLHTNQILTHFYIKIFNILRTHNTFNTSTLFFCPQLLKHIS